MAARHRHLGHDVAAKVLAPGAAGDRELGARFLAEAKLLASLDHPHIVRIFDFVEVDGLCVLAVEAGRRALEQLAYEEAVAISGGRSNWSSTPRTATPAPGASC